MENLEVIYKTTKQKLAHRRAHGRRKLLHFQCCPALLFAQVSLSTDKSQYSTADLSSWACRELPFSSANLPSVLDFATQASLKSHSSVPVLWYNRAWLEIYWQLYVHLKIGENTFSHAIRDAFFLTMTSVALFLWSSVHFYSTDGCPPVKQI